MLYLKADTITEVTIGPAVAVGDGFTPVTGLVGSSADEFEIIKHGATATTTIAGTLAAITGADGYYALDLSATDTDTEGRLVLLINDDSLILPLRHEFMVVNANVFDSMFAAAGTDVLDVNVVEWLATTPAAYSTTRGTSGTALPAAAADAALGLPISDAGGLDLDTKLANTNEVTAARMAALTDWIDGGRLDLLLDLITAAGPTKAEMDTAHGLLATEAKQDIIDGNVDDIETQIGIAGVGLTDLGGMSTTMKGQVNTEVDGALDTTIAEATTGSPPTTPTLREAAIYPYMALTRKLDVQTSGTDAKEYHNKAGTQIWKKDITDDGSDYSEADGA